MSVGLNLFFVSLFSVIIFSDLDALVSLLMVNGIVQLSLFLLVACLPFLRTKRVSYVDIAWPFGVALIGVQILLIGETDLLRQLLVGGIYLLIGLRMGIGALVMANQTGVIFKTEFPRYQYRRMMLEDSGSMHV